MDIPLLTRGAALLFGAVLAADAQPGRTAPDVTGRRRILVADDEALKRLGERCIR